MEFLQLHWDIV